ncbi:hypothetical protein GUJ93_ZPchr0006g42431 [Zizania palustris]|uniref:Uncharacterized protein n=1 Tax=Zizania palustris TaxID=103762 RepID=A0A8J5T9Y0_ZIZPA|nr:hypothetical protein GUJ93_ZPchr0006g42431 [Zizania palustris]
MFSHSSCEPGDVCNPTRMGKDSFHRKQKQILQISVRRTSSADLSATKQLSSRGLKMHAVPFRAPLITVFS